jgi:hypothetical protein
MKVKGKYIGKEEEMRLQVVDKEQNRRLVTKQVQVPFKNRKVYRNFKIMMAEQPIFDIQLTMNFQRQERLQI